MRQLDRKIAIAGLLVTIGLGLLLTMASWFTADRRLERRVADVEVAIQEELPVGVDLNAVFAFLDSRGIEHSEYVAKSRAVYAAIRNAVVKWPISYGIFIRFHFDETGLLTSHDVDVAGDAP